jgi:hypothetical protein
MAIETQGDTFETGSLADPVTEDSVLLPRDSDETPVVSVVMPTLNEEDGIEDCIARVRMGLCELGVVGEVIVSDSSTDRTAELAREAGAIVVEPDRDGYGYAYRYGFQHVRGEYVVMGDADTTYDFASLPRLLRPIRDGDGDIVLGSRFEGEIKPGAMPLLHRYVGNPLLTKFLNVFYRAGVTDAHSGFRAFRRDVLDTLVLRSDGMEFASEMVMAAATKDLAIEEVPIVYHEREGEETLDSLTDGWRHVKFMLMNAPKYLFTVPSLAFMTVGVLVMVASLTGNQYMHVMFSTYTMVGGMLLTIVGYQVGTLAVFSSIAANPISESTDRITRWVRESVSLEQGASAGLVLLTVSGVVATALTAEWVTSGYSVRPPLPWLLLCFTGLVLGAETVFSSFFMSMLGQRGEEGPTLTESRPAPVRDGERAAGSND